MSIVFFYIDCMKYWNLGVVHITDQYLYRETSMSNQRSAYIFEEGCRAYT